MKHAVQPARTGIMPTVTMGRAAIESGKPAPAPGTVTAADTGAVGGGADAVAGDCAD